MATAFLSSKAAADSPTFQGEGNEGAILSATYTLLAALVISDTIKMVKIPKGMTVTDVELCSDDIDTNVTPLVTLDVGDSAGATTYLAASTVGQAGGRAKSTRKPKTYTADDYIIVNCAAAPATGVVGDISVIVKGYNP